MKMSSFQMVVTALFVFFILAGVGTFALFGGLSGAQSTGKVVIWGTVESSVMEALLQDLRTTDKSLQDVQYVQVNASNYEETLINAMASGKGPDLFLLRQDSLLRFADKLTLVPYGSYSDKQFKTGFIDEGQLFLSQSGVLAFPFLVDPLVMYWNRDMFATAGLAQPPQTWNDLINIAPKMTGHDVSQNIKKSAVALGQYDNVANAKEILSTLMMQAGDPITARDASGNLAVTLGTIPSGSTIGPAAGALGFYTEFANPAKSNYSWNRSLPNSRDAFVAGDLGVYFGFASELPSITQRNPNLHFAVAQVPQLGSSRNTFGRLIGVAIARTSTNPNGAFLVAQKITGQAAAIKLVTLTGLPPARRDVSVDTSSNAAAEALVQSALVSRAWLDPSRTTTDRLFKGMIDSVVSGKSDAPQAVFDASRELTNALTGQ
jgi:ABC-type glycerol-3-phosphate transport system substrate-binding protein